jgi:hypothetical protein
MIEILFAFGLCFESIRDSVVIWQHVDKLEYHVVYKLLNAQTNVLVYMMHAVVDHCEMT